MVLVSLKVQWWMGPPLHEGHQSYLEGCLFLVSYVACNLTATVSAVLSLQKCNLKNMSLTPSMARHAFVALFTDLGPAVASLISSGPRTSSPSTAMDGVVS